MSKYMNMGKKATPATQDKEKAVIVKSFDTEYAVLELTEKNCIVIRKKTATGLRWSHNIMATQALLHAEFGCPVFQSIVESPEFQANIENKERAKVSAKMQEELTKHNATAEQMFQASIDRLVASGRYTKETAVAHLLGKVG